MDLCSIDGCKKPKKARGWCDAHWAMWKLHGDPLYVRPPRGSHALADVDEQTMTATCKTCGLVAIKRRTGKNSKGYRCSVALQDRAKKHSDRSAGLKQRYGITLDEFEEIARQQDYKCLICGEEPDGNLHVDHDHQTGKIRGLLCGPCNRRLGFVEDVEWLTAALEYLGVSV